MPITAIASILHRLSGALIFLATPLLLYILTTSLKNNSGFLQARQFFDSTLVQLISILLIWSLVHHFLAGIRYLIIDLDYGLSKRSANLSALIVIALGILISIVLITGAL